MEAVEIGIPLPAESASPRCVKALVLEAPPVVVEYVQPTPVVMQGTVPTGDAVQKTVEVPQIQHIENIVNIPVVSQRQALTIHTETVEVSQNQFFHRVVDVPVVTAETCSCSLRDDT